MFVLCYKELLQKALYLRAINGTTNTKPATSGLQPFLSHIPELREVGNDLVKLAQSQFPGLSFSATPEGRYVARPNNYVTFKIHSQRARNITVTLRGNPVEFPHVGGLLVRPDRAGYSSFRLTNVDQCEAASMCIRRPESPGHPIRGTGSGMKTGSGRMELIQAGCKVKIGNANQCQPILPNFAKMSKLGA